MAAHDVNLEQAEELRERFRGNRTPFLLVLGDKSVEGTVEFPGIPVTIDDDSFRFYVEGLGGVLVRFDQVIAVREVAEPVVAGR